MRRLPVKALEKLALSYYNQLKSQNVRMRDTPPRINPSVCPDTELMQYLPGWKRYWAHCHRTGEFAGLICFKRSYIKSHNLFHISDTLREEVAHLAILPKRAPEHGKRFQSIMNKLEPMHPPRKQTKLIKCSQCGGLNVDYTYYCSHCVVLIQNRRK